MHVYPLIGNRWKFFEIYLASVQKARMRRHLAKQKKTTLSILEKFSVY